MNSGDTSVARRWALVGLAVVLVVAACRSDGLGVSPQGSPGASAERGAAVAWDEHGLIAHAPAARQYASGPDLWEVWVCEVPEGADVVEFDDYGEERVDVDVTEAAAVLDRTVSVYFAWLSGDRYVPSFEPGGTLAIEADVESAEDACLEQAEESVSGAAGTVVVVGLAHEDGLAEERPPCTTSCVEGTFPSNGRLVLVGAHAVVVGREGPPAASTVAHELGHVLEFPHSFVNDGSGSIDTEYNNPIDAMSHDLFATRVDGVRMSGGTLAVNRYAAGWIDPEQVAVHEAGTATYEIGPIGHAGIQLVAVRSDHPWAFVALDARVREGYDAALPVEGVTVHAVDQRPATCPDPVGGVCSAVRRRQQQLPANAYSHDHVLLPGERLETVGVRIEVLARDGAVFTVRVTGTASFPPLDPAVQ